MRGQSEGSIRRPRQAFALARHLSRAFVMVALAASFVGCSAFESSDAGEVATGALLCRAGKSFAGIEYTNPVARFDGVTASVAAMRAVEGLAEDEHMSALVGVGDGQRLYAAVNLGGFVDGGMFAFAQEYGKPGDFAFLPLYSVPVASVGQPHLLRVHRLQGTSWAVEIDGRRVGDVVDLPGSRRGLAYPHVFLSSTNTELPCDNEGGFAFSNVSLLPHGGLVWKPFPPGSQMRAWPGYKLEDTERRSFTAVSE